MTPSGILLSDDLIFTSRVVGAGRDLGLSIRTARNADAVLKLSQQQFPTCVIVDLSNPGLRIAELIAGLGALTTRPRIVAYGSHVDTATLRAAREAGCDVVLPRSAFFEQFPSRLAEWLAPPAVS